MCGSGKRGMRTSHEQNIDRMHFHEELAEKKPKDSASKWFKRKAYSIQKEGNTVAEENNEEISKE